MWDKDDHFTRWFQAFCALPLLARCVIGTYLSFATPPYDRADAEISGSVAGAAYLAYRCLRYAITGRNNVNRNDY